MRVFTVLLFQKTDGSTQTSRHYHWGDGHQPNRFKPAQTSIQTKSVCCFVRTKICIQNIKTVLRHCLFDRNLGKGINSAISMMHCKQSFGSFKKMRFRSQRIHWFHVNGNSIHVKKKTMIKINMRIQIYSDLC